MITKGHETGFTPSIIKLKISTFFIISKLPISLLSVALTTGVSEYNTYPIVVEATLLGQLESELLSSPAFSRNGAALKN